MLIENKDSVILLSNNFFIIILWPIIVRDRTRPENNKEVITGSSPVFVISLVSSVGLEPVRICGPLIFLTYVAH